MTARSISPLRGLARGVAFAWLAAGGAAACGDNGEAAPSRPGRPGGPGGLAEQITPVETVRAEQGVIVRRETVSGTVEPIRSIGINSQVGGAVLEVLAEEGDRVRAGQVLARMDDREIRARVASARANFEVAEAAYERSEQLRERQVITAAEYERDRAAYAAADAQLQQLDAQLGYTTIRSPSSGVVTAKSVEAGHVVGAQTRLFTVGDLSTMVVRVPVSELNVVELEAGDRVTVTLDAYPGRTFDGSIRRVFPAADPETRLVPVEVAIGAAGAELARPGFLARVSFPLGAEEGVLLLPATAVIGTSGQTEMVYVIEEGRADQRAVQTGRSSQGRVEIVSGIEPGEIVVVTGGHDLRNGAEVRIMAGPGAPVADAARAEAGGSITRGEQ